MKDGVFPKPVQLGLRAVGWLELVGDNYLGGGGQDS